MRLPLATLAILGSTILLGQNANSDSVPERQLSVTGRVTDLAKRPIEGAVVSLFANDSSKVETKTNANGEYSFKIKLTSTTYSVTAQAMDVRNKYSRHGYMGISSGKIQTIQSNSFVQNFVVLPASKIIRTNEVYDEMRYELFLHNVRQGKKDKYRIESRTIEGDLTYIKLKFSGKKVVVIRNNRKDRFAGEKYKKVKIPRDIARQANSISGLLNYRTHK